MATPVVFNAVNYSIPAFGDVGYAQGPGNLSAYLIAIASGTVQPTGGLFSLTADLNFGPNFGLAALYYKTTTANIATAGQFRLAVTDTIDWRNNANTLNLPLGVNALDQLTFNGTVIGLVGGSVTSVSGTANQINSTGGTTPVISLSSTLIVPGTFTIPALTNQIVLGTTNTITVTAPAPAASRIYTIPDALAAANFVMTQGAQILNGSMTFTATIISSIAGNVNRMKFHETGNNQDAWVETFGSATASGLLFSVNRDPSSGVFTQIAQAAASFEISSGNAVSAAVIKCSNINNTTPTAVANFGVTGCSLIGTTTNNNAATGFIGEYAESVVSAINVGANTTFSNITSIPLTAGDWDVSLVCDLDVTSATSSQIIVGLSTDSTPTTFSDSVTGSNQVRIDYLTTAFPTQIPLVVPVLRASLNSSTTYFVKCRVIYTGTTPKFYGRISARRVR